MPARRQLRAHVYATTCSLFLGFDITIGITTSTTIFDIMGKHAASQTKCTDPTRP